MAGEEGGFKTLSGFCKHKVYMWYTDMYAGKTCMYKYVKPELDSRIHKKTKGERTASHKVVL